MASDVASGGPPTGQDSTQSSFPDLTPARSRAVVGDPARTVFGQVMGLVALTVGFAALGAYIGRNLSGGTGIVFFIAPSRCIFGLQVASARGREQLAIGLLFGLGLLLGLAVGPVLNAYAKAEPAALWQAAGATGAFVAGLGAIGYATRRDLSSWARGLFWALLALIVFGIVAIFVVDPPREHHLRGARPRDLRRLHDLRLQPPAPRGQESAVPIAAEHLPRHLQRVPVLAAAVRRRAELARRQERSDRWGSISRQGRSATDAPRQGRLAGRAGARRPRDARAAQASPRRIGGAGSGSRPGAAGGQLALGADGPAARPAAGQGAVQPVLPGAGAGGQVKSISSKGDTIQGTFATKLRYPPGDAKATPTTLFSTQVPTFWNSATLTALLQSKGVQVNAQSTRTRARRCWRRSCSASVRRCCSSGCSCCSRGAPGRRRRDGRDLGNFGRSQARRVDPREDPGDVRRRRRDRRGEGAS